ncbi:hypothetical protein FRB95_006751 [Tulasnella sp. JGI-2019a]|nr:hypothetical protein FRB95_006751 [Tulasnella sp. JGI-2019a]
MVYILAENPHDSQLTYSSAYDQILRERRLAPDSSVILLVPPELDALCAAHILTTLFARDDVNLRTIPVAGYSSLRTVKQELFQSANQLHTIILLNIGSVLEITSPEWFGDFPSRVTIHLIDSARPFEPRNLFGTQPVPEDRDDEQLGPKVVVWDDGHAEKLTELRAAFDAMEYGLDSDSEDESEDEESNEESEEEYQEDESGGKKRRRSTSDDGSQRRRRRRTRESKDVSRLSREDRQHHRMVLADHYDSGTHHGRSAAGVAYFLCVARECADNDLLWLAILGLTHQYLSSCITREQYEHYYEVFNDEVARLNPPITNIARGRGDNAGVRSSTEFRFTLLQKWNLYDAMMHSGYVANKLGLWREEGTKKLSRILTKMGLSIQQSQQTYIYMNADLREKLPDQLEAIAPESGLIELVYPSFTKSFGNEMPRTCAADVLAGVGALLEAARGVKLTVEVEGGKGGGELFGSEKIWDLRKDGLAGKGKENFQPRSEESRGNGNGAGRGVALDDRRDGGNEGLDNPDDDGVIVDGQKAWIQNFWAAFDAVGSNTTLLRKSLPLAISLQRAIVRQGCAILSKRLVRFYTEFRYVKITEGPDLATFSHPSTLTRLTLWLIEATRDRIPKVHVARMSRRGKKKTSYPFVVACLNERTGTYVVVGVTGAPEIGEVRKNYFGSAFLDAKDKSHAQTRHGTFDTSVIEVNGSDLTSFIDALEDGCED